VLAWAPRGPTETGTEEGVTWCHWPRELARQSDMVTVLAVEPPGEVLVDAEFLQSLPIGASLVHLGHPGAVEEAALMAAVEKRRLRVAVDTFGSESTGESGRFRSRLCELPGVVATPRPGPEVRLAGAAKDLLLGLGFFEIITYAFQPDRLGSLVEADPDAPVLRLANPLSEEQAMMRASLLPGLLDTLRRNTLQQTLDVRLFELSKVFKPREGVDLPQEEHWLTGLMYGAREEAAWNAGRDPVNFFDLKGAVETLLDGLGIPDVNFNPGGLPGYLRYGARVFSGKRELGVLGELKGEIGDTLDLEGEIYAFNLDFAALCQTSVPPLFTPLPRYPAVYRDIALVLPEAVPAAQVAEVLNQHGRPWLVEARLFDVYTGDPVPAGKRSLAFRLSYRDPERTLTDDLVNAHHQKVVAALGKELGAELR
jgi:phenylalanyl-tRNA synthetase beta chain